ncbi:MAG TPA: FtsQ-type POTRA domain-containing protein [Gaiellaceae bacterium]|nr:FtsQ-type POTRA domain-containing protein [Gaiellaceae bacterium]
MKRLAPSGRSVLTGIALLVAAALAYGVARSTDAFAVDAVTVAGAPPAVAADVRKALAHARGESLLALDVRGLEREVEQLSWVLAASIDRAFPHTLAVSIVPERPVAVLRKGASSWLVSATGRVVAPLERRARLDLPRIWLGPRADLELGRAVAGHPQSAIRALAPLVRRPLPAAVASVRATDSELTLVLRSGFEIRLGDTDDLALKLEIARRIRPSLAPSGYLDVSVPKFPVAAETLNPQVEVEVNPSSSP